jgi:hypothetical protein
MVRIPSALSSSSDVRMRDRSVDSSADGFFGAAFLAGDAFLAGAAFLAAGFLAAGFLAGLRAVVVLRVRLVLRSRLRACFDNRHSRDAADFARFRQEPRAARCGDIGQARRQTGRAKSARPEGFRRKSPAGVSKPSTVLPDTLFGLLLPSGRFSHETRLTRVIQTIS